MTSFRKQHIYLIVTLVIIVGGAWFWMSDLKSDPPMYFAGSGQSLSTDPPQYVHHARNKILYDDFDPFDYPRWTVYRYSLVSFVAYLVFSIAGVSKISAGVVGVLLSLGALVLLLLAAYRSVKPWVVCLIAFTFVINVTLLTFGRVTYLENGLIFLTGLTCLLYSRWGNRLWGTILVGGSIALATLMGKLFGALLLPAVILTILIRHDEHRWQRIIALVSSFAIVSIGFIALLYGTDVEASAAYISEQAFGLRGIPGGLKSPWRFVEYVVSYGYQDRLFYINPDLLVLLATGLALLGVWWGYGKRLRDLPPVSLFVLCWLFCAFAGLGPLSYSPIRYMLFFIPAIILFGYGLTNLFLQSNPTAELRLRWPSVTALTISVWLCLFHFVANVFYFNVQLPPIRGMVWLTLPGAVGLALLVRWMLHRGMFKLNRPVLLGLVGVMILSTVVVNTARIRRLHFLDNNYNIVEANADLARILGPGAVVSGSYGPLLTLDNEMQSFVHFFMVADVDKTLFDRQPITHLAVDESNWTEAVKNYPSLQSVKPIGYYWIRDLKVTLYRISEVFRNPQAHSYQLSPYELAIDFVQHGQLDSAYIEVRAFQEKYPESKLGGFLLSDMLAMDSKLDESIRIMSYLARLYPTDFHVQVRMGRLLLEQAAVKKDPSLRNLAGEYFQRAVEADRFKAGLVQEIWLGSQNQGSQQPGKP